jgi:hypothetical protein
MDDLITRVDDELSSYGLHDGTTEILIKKGDHGELQQFVRVYARVIPPLLLAMSSPPKAVDGQSMIDIPLQQLLAREEEPLPDPPAVNDPVKDMIPVPGPRGTSVYYIYAPFSGKVYREPPTEVKDYCLVYGQGIYEARDGKWVLVDDKDSVMFYDEDTKDFLMVRGKSITPALAGLQLIPGDLLMDGAKGRIYLFDGTKWDFDPRASLKGPPGEAGKHATYTSIRVMSDTDIPEGIRTVFANAGKGTISLTLPRVKCSTHETPTWTICESQMVTIVNISPNDRGKIKVRVKTPDKMFEEAPTVITYGKALTYQSYGGVWYLVSQG